MCMQLLIHVQVYYVSKRTPQYVAMVQYSRVSLQRGKMVHREQYL